MILISAVITTGHSHQVLVKGFEEEYELLISPAIMKEFRETLMDNPETFHMTLDEIQEETETITYFGNYVLPDEEIDEIENDPSDNVFLEAAVEGNADYIVSGDPHLQELGTFRGIDIVNPREFLDILDE
ncbi:MAG: putative toxin-antitoxin system toxin component, PIN family [Candidatus Nanohaloarchaea archaeon]|nr:putative toxin-antitoxin system toxin component, PIN family [Candidatus Nanohaloarchaea archaeon]